MIRFWNRNASILWISSFFPLLILYGIFTVFFMLFVAWPCRREMHIPLSLPFVWISLIFPVSFFITAWAEHSSHWFHSDSDLPSAWWAANSEQFPGCFVCVGRLSCFPLPSPRGFLKPPAILFDRASEPCAVSQGSVVRVDIRDCSGQWICVYKWLQTILLPFSRTVLQLFFRFALKRTAQRTSSEKKMRVATPVPSEYCEIILKNHPVDPVSLESYLSNRFCPNRFRFIGKPLWNAKQFLPKIKHFEQVNLFLVIASNATYRCFLWIAAADK